MSGGLPPKSSRKTASATSRAPPLVVWSFPAPSMVTPRVCHLATHSSFHGIFPRPSKGETLPWCPQPLAHFTRWGRQWYSTSLPSQATTSVVPMRLHASQITWNGCHSTPRVPWRAGPETSS